MPETIKASEQNLNKVFCDDYVFEIPEYQRPYAWTTDEVGELLDDLLFAMEVSVEISATVKDGVSESVQRIVNENCETLKFRSHEFEEE